MTETTLVRRLLAHGSTFKARLFRNNTGMLRDERGNHVRYGLCTGSSDIIGWTPVLIGPQHVGRTLAIFTAFECKVGHNVTTVEQGAFLSAVQQQGGIAAVVRTLTDATAAVDRYIL